MAQPLSITPTGSTVAGNATTTSSSVYVPSLIPTNKWYVTNTSNNPVQIRVSTDVGNVVTAVFPTVGSPSLGPVLGSQDDLIIQIPESLVSSTDPAGFVSNVQMSIISTVGTGSLVYFTPIQ